MHSTIAKASNVQERVHQR